MSTAPPPHWWSSPPHRVLSTGVLLHPDVQEELLWEVQGMQLAFAGRGMGSSSV